MTDAPKPKYSLLTLILLFTIAGIGISHVSTTFQLQQANKEIERLELLDRKLVDEDISARLQDCMNMAGILRLGDLVDWSEESLMEIDSFGVTSMDELRELMKKRNLQFADR